MTRTFNCALEKKVSESVRDSIKLQRFDENIESCQIFHLQKQSEDKGLDAQMKFSKFLTVKSALIIFSYVMAGWS